MFSKPGSPIDSFARTITPRFSAADNPGSRNCTRAHFGN
jgi:hypothetical protein